MKGPVEPVHRSVPETIQEVIELTGFLCFLFRSTPTSEDCFRLSEGNLHLTKGLRGEALPQNHHHHPNR